MAKVKHLSRGRKSERSPYLVPGPKDAPEEHEEVTHGNQACPDGQGEDVQKLLEDGLDADQHEHAEEEGQSGGDGDDKGDVLLHVLQEPTQAGVRGGRKPS